MKQSSKRKTAPHIPTFKGLMEKVFVADDKFADVIVALERRGWTRSRNANSPNFRLKWRNLSNINFGLVRTDQFINHVFNSQQLSNKALLTGHLRFHQDQHDEQLLEGGGGLLRSVVKDAAPSALDGVSNSQVQNVCSSNAMGCGLSGPVVHKIDPEAFFPRCWDVGDDDGFPSMLKAFVVSAAVALLRRAVTTEEARQISDSVRGNDNAKVSDALAAAVSVTSRYVESLQQSAPFTLEKTDPSKPAIHKPDHIFFVEGCNRRASGQDAADASVNVEDPESVSVLMAWEVIAAAEELGFCRDEGSKNALLGDKYDANRFSKTGSRRSGEDNEIEPAINGEHPRRDRLANPNSPPLLEASRGETTPSRTPPERPDFRDGHELGGSTTTSRRAREVLEALVAADPQSGLLGPANAWVVKPAGLSCGRGVVAVSSLRGLLSACRGLRWKAVVQKYVERPFLVQGYKFDIRQWVLVTSCNPLILWGFDESYIRFSSRQFTMDASSLSDRFVHLCNHSVQKEQNTFHKEHNNAQKACAGVHKEQAGGGAPKETSGGAGESRLPPSSPYSAESRSAWEGEDFHRRAARKREVSQGGKGGLGEAGDGPNCAARVVEGGAQNGEEEWLPSGAQGGMWSADQLRRHLRHRYQGKDVFRDVVMPRIRSVVVQTLLGVREGLEMKGRGLEWLGFDLMLTDDLQVMLIEVNGSPDVSHSTPVTARLVPPATEDALRLLLDDGEADARANATLATELQRRHHHSSRLLNTPSASPTPEESGDVELLVASGRPDAETAVEATGASVTSDQAWVNGERQPGRQEELEVMDEALKWGLWHKGEEEPRATLRRLREEKKACFKTRRRRRLRCPLEHGRQQDRHSQAGRPTGSKSANNGEDKKKKTLVMVDGIVEESLAKSAGLSYSAAVVASQAPILSPSFPCIPIMLAADFPTPTVGEGGTGCTASASDACRQECSLGVEVLSPAKAAAVDRASAEDCQSNNCGRTTSTTPAVGMGETTEIGLSVSGGRAREGVAVGRRGFRSSEENEKEKAEL